VLVSLLSLPVVGCSGGSEKKVTGTVTLDQKPLAEASLEFVGETGAQGAYKARTDAEGKFEILSPGKGKPAMQPGRYKVFASKLVPAEIKGKKVVIPPEHDAAQLEASGVVVDLLKKRYNDHEFPKLYVDLKEGSDTLPTIELKSK